MPPTTEGAVTELSRHVVFYNVVLCAFFGRSVDLVSCAKPAVVLLAPAVIFATYITPCPGAVMVIELVISLDLLDCFKALFHCYLLLYAPPTTGGAVTLAALCRQHT